jgi:hypothetical protein
LWSGEPGRKAWEEWCERVGDTVELLRDGNEGLKELLPLISAALSRNGVVVEETLQTCLRTAALREELRISTYRRILGQVLSTYAEKRIPAIVVNGAALADTVYESPSLRHSGAIEILIRDFEPLRAVSSLLSLGFSQLNEVNSNSAEIKLKHNSGLPLNLYRSLFPVSYYDVPLDDLWARSQTQPVAEIPTRILSPTDSLMHVCGNAFFSRSRRTLLWVFDSWFIVNKHSNFDWDRLLETARRSRLELPLSVTIGYLAEKLNAPIPLSLLERLYAAASEADAEGRAYALSIVREEVKGNYIKMLLMAGSWRACSCILSWILSSPMSHLKWLRYNFRPRLLSRYLFLPLRGLFRRTLSLCKTLARQ